jgi:hypothetical protein
MQAGGVEDIRDPVGGSGVPQITIETTAKGMLGYQLFWERVRKSALPCYKYGQHTLPDKQLWIIMVTHGQYYENGH